MGVGSDDSLQGGSERCVCVCVETNKGREKKYRKQRKRAHQNIKDLYTTHTFRKLTHVGTIIKQVYN